MFRKREKLTQAQLALKIDKSFNYINSIECAAFFPPPETIQKIAEALNIRPMQLFDENENPATVISDNKEKLISTVTERIFDRFRKNLKEDLAQVIEEITKL